MLRYLLPLLLLAALLPPRGARMVWCVCFEEAESLCCTGCCPSGEGEHGADEQHESDCCLAVEVVDFEQVLEDNTPADVAPARFAQALASPNAQLTSLRPSPVPACHGPPRRPPPAGLLAGVRPLRV